MCARECKKEGVGNFSVDHDNVNGRFRRQSGQATEGEGKSYEVERTMVSLHSFIQSSSFHSHLVCQPRSG